MLEQLHDALAARVTPLFTAAAAARVKRLAAAAKQRLAEAARLAADHGEAGAINPHYLMAELGRVLDDEDIVFNEAVRNVGATMTQIPRPVANTLIDSGGAGLGWSGGMALGAKLAAPARMMVQLVGDGSFYFNVPTSVFAVAQQYRLPLLTIVLDNSGWQAVKQSTLRVFPDGEAKASNEFEAELASNVDYGRVAEAFGAYAEKVSDPASVPEAIARCAKIVRGGRSALLHVKITRL
jgi:acetolactate synthase-1/2/3 large subunit